MASGAQYETVLRQVVAKRRAEAVENLTLGSAADFAEYREQIGYIRALDQLDEWCVEVGETLEER